MGLMGTEICDAGRDLRPSGWENVAVCRPLLVKAKTSLPASWAHLLNLCGGPCPLGGSLDGVPPRCGVTGALYHAVPVKY